MDIPSLSLKIIVYVFVYVSLCYMFHQIFPCSLYVPLTGSFYSQLVGISYAHLASNYNFVCLLRSLLLPCIIDHSILLYPPCQFLCLLANATSHLFIRPRHLTLRIYSWFTSNRSFPRPWSKPIVLYVFSVQWQPITNELTCNIVNNRRHNRRLDAFIILIRAKIFFLFTLFISDVFSQTWNSSTLLLE